MRHGRTAARSTRYRTLAAAVAGLLTVALLTVAADAAPSALSEPARQQTSAQPAERGTRQPFWSAEFTGRSGTRPDADVWTSEVGNRRQQGWWNNELQYYTARAANAALNGSGKLLIRARRAARNAQLPCWPRGRCRYTSARLTTEGTVSLRYGRIDVSARLPTGRGLLPAIWMLGDNGRIWPRQGEIDIVEVVGGEPRTAHGTAHGPGYANEDGIGASVGLGARASRSFHLYSVVKRPRRLTWLVDDEPYLTLRPRDLPPRGEWVFEQDLHLLLNVAVGGDWPGDPRPSTRFPAAMAVDYVRMYGRGVVDGVTVSGAR